MNEIKYKLRDKYFDWTILLLICLYKSSLDLSYIEVIYPIFIGSYEFSFNFQLLHFIVGWIAVIIGALLLPKNYLKPSAFFVTLIFIVSMVPFSSMFAFEENGELYYTTIYISFIICECIIANYDITPFEISLKILEKSAKILIIVFYFITVFVYIDIVIENGMFTFDAIHLSNVYVVRSEFHMNKYVSYLFAWQYMVITPFMLVRALEQKKYFVAMLFLVLQVIAYLYQAQKSVLFVLVLIVSVYCVSKFKNIILHGIYIAILCLTTLSFIAIFSDKIYVFYSLFIRRMLLLPGRLKYIYFDFFSNNEKLGLGGTLWGKLLGIDYPYDIGYGRIIGKEYFYSDAMNANTGFFAEGYVRWGYFGIFIVFIVFIIILLLIDYLYIKSNFAFAISISVFSIMGLNDGFILESLFTGNLFILVIICLLYSFKYDFFHKKENSNYE